MRILWVVGVWLGCGIQEGETQSPGAEHTDGVSVGATTEITLTSTQDFARAEATARKLVRADQDAHLQVTLSAGTYSGQRLRLDGRKRLSIEVRAQGEVVMQDATMVLSGRTVSVQGVHFTGSRSRPVHVVQIDAESEVSLTDLELRSMSAGSAKGTGSTGAQQVPGALIHARLSQSGRVQVSGVSAGSVRVPNGSVLAVHSGMPTTVSLRRLSVSDAQVRSVLHLPGVGQLDVDESVIELVPESQLLSGFSGTYRRDGQPQAAPSADYSQ